MDISISVWKACELAGIDPEARPGLAYADRMGLEGEAYFRAAIVYSVAGIKQAFAGLGEMDAMFGEIWTVRKAQDLALSYARAAEGLARIAKAAGVDLDLGENMAYELANCRQIIASIVTLYETMATTEEGQA
jgi:hypothetical protein